MHSYLRFLASVGSRELPNSLESVASKLKTTQSYVLLTGDTLFYLEKILIRFVYGTPEVLKGKKALSDAVLFLLDQMVDVGSSSAYRMRDDFVTPASRASAAQAVS